MKRLRRFLLLSALTLSLGAALWVRSEEDGKPEIVVPTRQDATSARIGPPSPEDKDGMPALALDRLSNRTTATSDVDPFRVKTWFVAPPAPPPPPPPKPTAPPLPYTYVGKFEDTDAGGKLVVYLAKGNDSFAVSPGDTFDDIYRFEKLDKGNLVFEYLPLAIKQRLPVGIPE
jgi:hypothetical protein